MQSILKTLCNRDGIRQPGDNAAAVRQAFPPDLPPTSSSPFPRPRFAKRLVYVCFLLMLLIPACAKQRRGRPNFGSEMLAVGAPAPEISAEGWLNGPGPDATQLKGKVVVIDAWASWCGPCRSAAPHLVEVHKKFKDSGVVFIGLTNEDESRLDEMKDFLQGPGITWPNGYGAGPTLGKLGMTYIPSLWVIGTDGKIVWNTEAEGELEDGISRALAQGTK